jgi:predicted oxidoreductase (fatty acid repression mutant protein)
MYAYGFPQWSEHSSAMHQFALWTALEAEGFGASLQHYCPLVGEQTAARWSLPASWTLKAQLVFGGKVGGPADELKTQKPLEERLKVYGA